MNGTIGATTLFGYKVEAHGRFAAVGNPNPQHASLNGTGSVEVYRYDPALGTYSYYGIAQSRTAGSSGTAGTGGSSANMIADQYGKSFDLYNNVFIVGDSFFSGSYNSITYPYKSMADVYLLNQTSSSQSVLNSTLQFPTKINSPLGTSYNTFGNSVSINNKYIVVGANGSGDGKVYVYSYTTGSNSVSVSGPVTQINASLSGRNFGTIVRIDKSGSNSILISESPSIENPKVYLYDSSSSGWKLTHTFTSITGSKNVPFDDFESYGYVKNSYDGFGSDIQINGDTIIIGAPNDASYYEYSGSSTQYDRGAAYIYSRTDCPTNYTDQNNIYFSGGQVYWDLELKYIGDKNTIKGNKLGCSVDVFGNKILVGCISSSNDHAIKSEVSSSISQSYDDTGIILGQFELFEKSGSIVTPVTYDYKKKSIGYPYMSYGYDVAISERAIFIGSPFIVSDFTSSNTFVVSPAVSQASLSNMRGHVYISTLDSLRTNFHAGNVFYKNGEIVLSNSGSQFANMFKTVDTNEYKYDLTYKSTYTINERSIICTINPGEFNVSTNVSALDVTAPVFDLHGDGEFDFRDLNLIMLYIVDINTPGTPSFATDDTIWDDYVIEDETERSLFEYYKDSYDYGRYTLKVEYQRFYESVRALEPKFDFDGDGKITINDAKILWKHFVKKLDDTSYSRLINPLSTRKNLTDVVAYLTSLTSKYATTDGVPTIKDVFSEYNYSSSMDVTGSYLAPYVTTVGLYSGADLVAVAKLSSPIKNTGEYPLNFLIKWDV